MDISTFDDLLQAARQQPDPQRLLFVFAGAGVSADSTPEQRARFEAGEGGELTPIMCVDKAPQDLGDFAALQAEAKQFSSDWALVFTAALSGRGGQPPSAADTEAALQRMVESVRAGELEHFIPFDRDGQAVLFN